MIGVRASAVLCEDLTDLNRAIGVMLSDCGFAVLAVSSSDDTLAAVRASQPEVVVIDIALSGRFGLGLIPAVIAAAPNCRVIVLSALDGLHDRVLAAGAIELLRPTDLRPLRGALQAVLNDQIHGCTCGDAGSPVQDLQAKGRGGHTGRS